MQSIDIYSLQRYMGQAFNFLRNKENAEDAIQDALEQYLNNKDTLVNNEKPEKIIRFLIKQACIQIYYDKNHIKNTKRRENGKIIYGKNNYGAFIQTDSLSDIQKNKLESTRVSYNDGEFLCDFKVLNSASKVSQMNYFNMPFAERNLGVSITENLIKNNKYLILRRGKKHIKSWKVKTN